MTEEDENPTRVLSVLAWRSNSILTTGDSIACSCVAVAVSGTRQPVESFPSSGRDNELNRFDQKKDQTGAPLWTSLMA